MPVHSYPLPCIAPHVKSSMPERSDLIRQILLDWSNLGYTLFSKRLTV